MIYIPSLIKTGSDIQKLIGERGDTQTAWWSHKPTFTFFRNKKIMLKTQNAGSSKFFHVSGCLENDDRRQQPDLLVLNEYQTQSGQPYGSRIPCILRWPSHVDVQSSNFQMTTQGANATIWWWHGLFSHQRLQISIGALCYHNLKQYHYDFTVGKDSFMA
jgi:hypothetical protein